MSQIIQSFASNNDRAGILPIIVLKYIFQSFKHLMLIVGPL